LRGVTLTVAWVRKVGRVSELVFASDSRLRFGAAWDCCPKLFTLPRSDCLISFAGDTHYTYPLLLQMINSMAFFSGSRTRRMDLARVKGHTLRIFNQMHDAVTDLPTGADVLPDPDALFLFGGYSWRHDDFRLWTIHYRQRQFTFAPIQWWRGEGQEKMVRFEGDHAVEAYDRLRVLLRGRKRLETGGLDMEPFEVLRDMIRNGEHPEIGGPPQLAKVYKHLNSQFFAIPWKVGARDQLCIAGRPMLSYERIEVPIVNPDGPFRPEYLPAPARSLVGESDETSDDDDEEDEDRLADEGR
jgi:hypothetical protein